MPVAPYTWPTNGFLTATLLNQELRRLQAQYFQPNGTGFHAQRPVYSGFYSNAVVSPSSGTWYSSYSATNWTINAETAAFLGGRGDQSIGGMFTSQQLRNGSGVAGTAGGLGLITGCLPFASSGTTASQRAGIGGYQNATPNGTGTMVMNNSAYSTTPWALDILDVANPQSMFYYVTGASQTLTSNESDGSGYNTRLMGAWASVYPANGTKVTTAPAPLSPWTGATSLTASLLNSYQGIVGAMNLLNMPPLLRAQAPATISVGSGSATTITYSTPTYDTYGAFASNAYTAPLAGLYLVATFVGVASSNTVNGWLQSGVNVNSTNYFGPLAQLVSGQPTAAAKVQILSLNSGDVLTHIASASAAVTTAGSPASALFIVLYLGQQGAPGTLPTVPDVTYNFVAGTTGGNMIGVLNNYLANDLQFLLQRPYCMSYQTTVQTNVPMGTAVALQCQSNTGIVHGDAGTNYGGWTGGTTNAFTAPRSGFYLCVTEDFFVSPTLTASPCFASGFQVTPGGLSTNDFYGKQNAGDLTGGYGGGAAGVAIYYLRAGDTIAPVCWANGIVSSGNTSTYISSVNKASHFECIWLAS